MPLFWESRRGAIPGTILDSILRPDHSRGPDRPVCWYRRYNRAVTRPTIGRVRCAPSPYHSFLSPLLRAVGQSVRCMAWGGGSNLLYRRGPRISKTSISRPYPLAFLLDRSAYILISPLSSLLPGGIAPLSLRESYGQRAFRRSRH